MHDPNRRIIKAVRRKKIAWIFWALSLLLIASGLLVHYTTFRYVSTTESNELEELQWTPLVEKTSVPEYYLQTRKIGYTPDGRRVDEKIYICTA
jgi:hypothetical protein